MTQDRIPTVEVYRGVGVHAFQSADRIARVVKPAIDLVLTISDPVDLAAYAARSLNPPEARLLARAKAQAGWDMAAEHRENRPDIDMTLLAASTAGLDSLNWIDPYEIGTLLDVRPAPGEEGRPLRDPHDTAAVELARGRR